ncbi:xylulokinase [Hoyosella altamirensis]|uniref:Xylulose kinase n=1 Tax=Hoyosella altamirensis TaxID=616997 RepID=A0A839RPQ8_9ACTN|nr:FGGY-family carbohydrate kinase [Hoyosella altamirensis]MBB3038299.1 xylulokinase [Hoyosella altamirensis]
MTLVAGIDSSTQSCKIVICEAETGEIVREGRATHPVGTEIDPACWAKALKEATHAAGGLGDVAALSVGAQQHGMVCIDESGDIVRSALLWNDVRSAQAATSLIDDLGSPGQWADAVGVVPLAAITVSKLRWLADAEPRNADRTAAVCLPHDWLSWQLSTSNDLSGLATDRSDASGTGYFSAAANDYRRDLLTLASRGRDYHLPHVAAPTERIGETDWGAVIGPGAGDNAGAALALAAAEGDVIVSIGTSGVVSAVSKVAPHDPGGFVAGFADATGKHLPLVCTLNGARVLDAGASMLNVDYSELSRLALSAPVGAEGLVMVPYLEGERTPNRPDATGAVHGLRLANSTPAHFARAAIEGLLCGLAEGIDHLVSQGVEVRRILLVGGGAKSEALCAIAPSIFGAPVAVPEPGEYVATGAARQAAWVLAGTSEPPTWEQPPNATYDAETAQHVRDRYAEVRDLTDGAA